MLMKSLLTNIKVYLISFMLTLLSIGASFLAYGISIWVKAEKPFPYYVVMLVFIFIYGLLAYVFGDLQYLKYKKEKEEFHPSLTEEERMVILSKRLPFIYALIITLLVLAVFFIISLFLKRWPLL